MISFDLFICVQSPIFELFFKSLHQYLVFDNWKIVLPQKWDDHAEDVRISVDENGSINDDLTLFISDELCEITFVIFGKNFDWDLHGSLATDVELDNLVLIFDFLPLESSTKKLWFEQVKCLIISLDFAVVRSLFVF